MHQYTAEADVQIKKKRGFKMGRFREFLMWCIFETRNMTRNFHPMHISHRLTTFTKAHSRCGATDDVSLCAKLAQHQARSSTINEVTVTCMALQKLVTLSYSVSSSSFVI